MSHDDVLHRHDQQQRWQERGEDVYPDGTLLTELVLMLNASSDRAAQGRILRLMSAVSIHDELMNAPMSADHLPQALGLLYAWQEAGE